ncbi:hypothetical protein [Leucobacter soli]|uniref:hypothetical protein n=1 Tax=Leucobacter soli TaxID=2812850 RepID=UPI00360DC767
MEQEHAGLEARVSALARSLDQRDASAALLAEEPSGIVGRVADHVRVHEGYEAAVGAALGVYADALLAESRHDAGEVVRAARERDLGRLRAVIARGEPRRHRMRRGSTGSRAPATCCSRRRRACAASSPAAISRTISPRPSRAQRHCARSGRPRASRS